MMSKKKILLYYSFPNYIGGPCTYINTIMQSPLKDKYNIVTCFQNSSPGGWDYKLLRRMVNQIRAEKPDVVHVQGLQSDGFYGVLSAKFAGCKNIVTTVHGFASDGDEYGRIKKAIYRRLVEPFTIRMSDKVFCVCRSAADRAIIRRNGGKRNKGVIYNPIPKMCVQIPREQMRAQLGIRSDEMVFIIASRVVEGKGFHVLGDAVKQLNGMTRNSFRLVVLGDGAYRRVFEQQMKAEIENDQVIIIGSTNRVADYLNAADVFVLPSYHENLPISLLEAGSMGLPCIASAVDGNVEIIENNRSGFLIEQFDSRLYAEKMKWFMEEEAQRKEMGEYAKTDICRRFSLEAFCEALDNVYFDKVKKQR